MGLFNKIFGTGDIIEKGIELIDKKFPTEADMIRERTKAKTELLTGYAPFKIAQRYLAVLFGITFVASYLLTMGMTLAGEPVGKVTATITAFKIDWIMLTIVGFYFGGGAFEGIIKRKKGE